MRLNPRFGRFSGHLAVGNGRRMRQVEGRSARICWLSGPQPAPFSFIGSVDSIITVGRLIAEAKAELRHGEFSAMIRADLPFGPRTARRLMAVAQHPVIAKGTHASVLPPSWTTLYELTRLPEETLEAKIAEGVIHAGIERKDVAALRRQLDPVPAGQREHSQNSVNHREAAPAAKALVDRMLALFRGGTADQRCDIVFEL
jgi:DUF3102 family protein